MMSLKNESKSEGINLERSELRYVFFSYDQESLIDDFLKLGFEKQIYQETPVTRTIYFGSVSGLERGMSLKARVYSHENVKNLWNISSDTEFQLLEIKSTLSDEEMSGLENLKSINKFGLIINENPEAAGNNIFRIQKASEDGLLRDSTMKLKSRLSKKDIKAERSISKLTLDEIITVLTTKSELDERLSENVLKLLNETVRPKYKKKLVPLVVTQYERIHLIPKNEDWRKYIRITIDPGVDYFNPILEPGIKFTKSRNLKAEFMKREKFSRLEFKIDSQKLSLMKDLEFSISNLLQKYGCLATISKKWTGITEISEYYIKKQALWREPLGTQISGYFPVDITWYANGFNDYEFEDIVKKSNAFEIFSEKKPRTLVKNENYVEGYLGVPIPSLIVNIEGPEIKYLLPPKSYPVKITRGEPDFYIIEDYVKAVRSTIVASKYELDDFLHPSIEVENNNFLRSYGFLVKAVESKRIYKLTIEQKVEVKSGRAPISEFYCKMRYLGTQERLYQKNKNAIFGDLQLFYNEFAKIMQKPLALKMEVDNKDIYRENSISN
ncbi:MAG: VTC domain-containing protein [Candidatus Heimdallarchaeota archaeon]